MYELNKSKCEYKTIYLNTSDATVNTDRTEFVFNKLPLIQVRGDRCYLKVVGVSMNGQGDPTGHSWIVKLRNVKHNGTSYYNSDFDAIPTIAMFNWDSKTSFQGGAYLKIDPQDINEFALEVKSNDNHGLLKSSQPIDMTLTIQIEEYYD